MGVKAVKTSRTTAVNMKKGQQKARYTSDTPTSCSYYIVLSLKLVYTTRPQPPTWNNIKLRYNFQQIEGSHKHYRGFCFPYLYYPNQKYVIAQTEWPNLKAYLCCCAPKGQRPHSPLWAAVDTSYSVQWDECFLKGREQEEWSIIKPLYTMSNHWLKCDQVYSLVLKSMMMQDGAIPCPSDVDSSCKPSSEKLSKVLTPKGFYTFLWASNRCPVGKAV
jgi:hypothetical protein